MSTDRVHRRLSSIPVITDKAILCYFKVRKNKQPVMVSVWIPKKFCSYTSCNTGASVDIDEWFFDKVVKVELDAAKKKHEDSINRP
jgi:hypothetical protein|tara:strand:+ start:1059 stop:1316 length:258 start_codon:yes stop_codon:yes gene_type:complete